MEPISIISGILSFTFDPTIEYLKNLEPALDKSYRKALKRWSKNNLIREKFANQQYDNFQKLNKYIVSRNNNIDRETALLLQFWEEELRQDPRTSGLILEPLERASLEKIDSTLNNTQEILENQNEISKQFEGFRSETSSQFDLFGSKLDTFLVEISQKKEIKEKITYIKPQPYIQRKVRDYDSKDFLDSYIHPEKYESKPLIDYVISDIRRIILYSEAQSGKSTELKNIAFELQQSEIYNPYLFSLNKYLNQQTLFEQVKFNTRFANDNRLCVLLLDSLDEVKDNDRDNLIREIESLSANYPNLFFIVSCRGNYEATNYIDGFKKLYLDEINYFDVKHYVKAVATNPTLLLAAIEEKQLYDFIYNPFYLQSIIKYFEKHNSLPERKAEIYDFIIEDSYEADKKRVKRGQTIDILRYKGIGLLEKIAFCLQSTEQNMFTIAELLNELGLSEEEISLCCNFTIFNRDKEDNVSFSHNTFREYFVAKKLTTIDFEKLKNIICFENSDKLRPSWYNVVILLISILKEKDDLYKPLIDWLIENEKEVLLKCEKHYLEDDVCFNVFKSIFLYFKESNLYIDWLNMKELMLFTSQKESILFLCNEIENEKTAISPNLINAVILLRYADFNTISPGQATTIENLLFECLDKYKEKGDQGFYFCVPFENSYFQNNGRIVSTFHKIISESTNSSVLNRFFELLVNNDVCDEYADWVYSKIKYIRSFTTEDGVTHSVHIDDLFDVFVHYNKIENIVKVLDYYTEKNLYHSYESKKIMNLKTDLLQKCKTLSATNTNDIYWQVALILEKEPIPTFSRKEYELQIGNIYRSFFFDLDIQNKIFEHYYKQIKSLMKVLEDGSSIRNKFDKCFNVLSTVLTTESLDVIMTDTELPEEEQWVVLQRLSNYEIIHTNENLATKINDKINGLRPQAWDFEKDKQDSFDILFDFEKIKNEVTTALAGIETLPANWEERLVLRNKNINNSVINYIWRYCERFEDERIIKVQKVIDSLEDENKLKENLFYGLERFIEETTSKKLKVTDKQLEIVFEITVEAILNPKLYHDSIGRSMKYVLAFNLELDEELLLELVQYANLQIKNYSIGELWDNNLWNASELAKSLIPYIHSKIQNKKKLHSKIEEIFSSNVLYSQNLYFRLVEYVIQHKVSSCYKYFIPLLHKNYEDDRINHSYKIHLIHIILSLGKEGMKIINSEKENFNIDLLLYYYKETLRLNLLNDTEIKGIRIYLEGAYPILNREQQEEAIFLLLQTGSETGLLLLIDSLKEKPEELHSKYPNLSRYGDEQLENLIVLFELSLTLNDNYYRDRCVQEASSHALKELAMKSIDNRDRVISLFRDIAKRDKSYSYLNRVANDLYNKYYEVNSTTLTIKQALSCYAFLNQS